MSDRRPPVLLACLVLLGVLSVTTAAGAAGPATDRRLSATSGDPAGSVPASDGIAADRDRLSVDAVRSVRAGTTGDAARPAAPTVVVERVVRETDSPSTVRITFRYTIPANIAELTVTGVAAPDDSSASVVGTNGFSETDSPGTWAWDTETDDPTITVEYALPTGRLTRADHGTTGEGWSFVKLPYPRHGGQYTGQEPVFDYRTTVRGNGTGTEAYAFLGEYETHSRATRTQEFFLYVPEDATLAEDPETLLGYYVEASRRLRIGGRDEQVHGFAVPSAGRHFEPVGQTRGENSFYVDANAPVGGDETWVHEYVHTRQTFAGRTSTEARWLVEGSASYYGIVLRAHSADWSERRLYDRIAGSEPGVLTDPSTWSQLTPYVEGRKFVAHLNLRLREATDGNVSAVTVIGELNRRHQRLTHESLINAIAVHDEATAEWADRTLRSEGSLSTPREPEAYLFEGSVPDDDGLNVSVEESIGSSPFATDTDGDGRPDDVERRQGTDPTVPRETPTETGPIETGEAGPKATPPGTATECPADGEPDAAGCSETDDGGTGLTPAIGPVGPAPVLAVAIFALVARSRARRR